MTEFETRRRCGRTQRIRNRCKISRSEMINIGNDRGFVNLLQWMKARGFKADIDLFPAVFEGLGRGLATKTPISEGSTIISIPEALLITTKTAINSFLYPYLVRFSKEDSKYSPMKVLSIFLMCERVLSEESEWHPYISLLPKTYGTPAYFSEKEIENLSPVYQLKEKSSLQKRKMQDAYSDVTDFLSCLENEFPQFRGMLTIELFQWAWFTIKTRAVFKKMEAHELLNSEPDTYALAPYLDMLNHSCTTQVQAGFDDTSHSYKIVTKTSHKSYSQVFINYGPHDNYTLLLDYGFILSNNIQHSIEFSIENIILTWISKQKNKDNIKKGLKKRLNIIREENLKSDLTCTNDGPSWSFLRLLHILSLTDEELQNWQKQGENNFFTESTQETVMHIAQLCIEEKLTSYLSLEEASAVVSEDINMLKRAKFKITNPVHS